MAEREERISTYIREHIKRAREEKGISQSELAEAIGKKSNVSISDIERGRVGVSAVDLILIAKLLGRDINYFARRPDRVRIPRGELTPDETQLVADYIRLNNFELQGTVLYLVARLAEFSQKGEFNKLIDESIELGKRFTGRD